MMNRYTKVLLMMVVVALVVGTVSAAAPVANFTADKTRGSQTQPVTFTDSSTNVTTAWAWYYSNATGTVLFNSTSGTPSNTFNNGTYDIYLNASNADGFSWKNRTAYIVEEPPVADFTISSSSGHAPYTVHLTDTSVDGVSVEWYWGTDESVSANDADFYQVFQAGTYNIRMKSTNYMGTDWENKTGVLTVTTPPIPPTSATTSIVAALNIGGVSLIVVGIVGVITTLTGIGGVGMSRSGYGGGQTDTKLIVASVMAIMLGAVILILSYIVIGPIIYAAGG